MRRTGLLLALCAPLLACPGDDEGETDASSAGSSGLGTTAATSTGEPATGPDGSGAATTSGSSGPANDGSSGGEAGPLEACVATCERLVECEVQDVPNCGIPCAMIDTAVAGCEPEYLAQQTCAAALTCEELQTWADAMMMGADYPCEAEDDAFQGCLAGGGSGSGG